MVVLACCLWAPWCTAFNRAPAYASLANGRQRNKPNHRRPTAAGRATPLKRFFNHHGFPATATSGFPIAVSEAQRPHSTFARSFAWGSQSTLTSVDLDSDGQLSLDEMQSDFQTRTSFERHLREAYTAATESLEGTNSGHAVNASVTSAMNVMCASSVGGTCDFTSFLLVRNWKMGLGPGRAIEVPVLLYDLYTTAHCLGARSLLLIMLHSGVHVFDHLRNGNARAQGLGSQRPLVWHSLHKHPYDTALNAAVLRAYASRDNPDVGMPLVRSDVERFWRHAIHRAYF